MESEESMKIVVATRNISYAEHESDLRNIIYKYFRVNIYVLYMTRI